MNVKGGVRERLVLRRILAVLVPDAHCRQAVSEGRTMLAVNAIHG